MQYGGSEAHTAVFQRQRGDWQPATRLRDKLISLRRAISNGWCAVLHPVARVFHSAQFPGACEAPKKGCARSLFCSAAPSATVEAFARV